MKLSSKLLPAIAAIALNSASQAASIIGVINFSSGADGGVTLQDSLGNDTTVLANATGIKTWLFPTVNGKSDSFVSVPTGQAVIFSQPWVFSPSTPMTPLWRIEGFGDFAFNLTSSTVTRPDADTLLVEGTGTLTGTNFDDTPGTWYFSTQYGATESKFSWSSSTESIDVGTPLPELGTPTILGGALLWICFLRRRDLN